MSDEQGAVENENENPDSGGKVIDFPVRVGQENVPESPSAKARREREERLEQENELLLQELKTGETRILKRDGAGRIIARKALDEVTGAAVIVRSAEYGENPFKPVFFQIDELRVEAMKVNAGVILSVNGVPSYVPGANLIEDSENPGFFKVL